MAEIEVVDRQHDRASPSGAHRWINCPGSVRMAELVPPPPPSPYAEEGSKAHAAAEYCLRQGIRDVHGVIDGLEAEQEDAVQTYLNFVWPLIDAAIAFGVEKRVSIPLGAHTLFGYVDFWALVPLEDPNTYALWVVDYKHGAGVPVAAQGNYQLALYAHGVLASLDSMPGATIYVMAAVVQPRARHRGAPIRVWAAQADELVDIALAAEVALDEIASGSPRLQAGPHCRFCPALAVCPEVAEQARTTAQAEFADLRLLSPDDVGELLAWADDVFLPWVAAMREYVHQQLSSGGTVKGWKLVQRRCTRRWRDEEAVLAWAKKMRLKKSQIYKQTLISPAQMEKLVGKRLIPADLIVAESSGTTIAREEDPRSSREIGAEFFENEEENV